MEECPHCSAKIRHSGECYRCGFDFTPLMKCEAEAERYYRKALVLSRAGLIAEAGEACLKSLQFDNREQTCRLKRYLMLTETFLVPEKG